MPDERTVGKVDYTQVEPGKVVFLAGSILSDVPMWTCLACGAAILDAMMTATHIQWHASIGQQLLDARVLDGLDPNQPLVATEAKPVISNPRRSRAARKQDEPVLEDPPE